MPLEEAARVEGIVELAGCDRTHLAVGKPLDDRSAESAHRHRPSDRAAPAPSCPGALAGDARHARGPRPVRGTPPPPPTDDSLVRGSPPWPFSAALWAVTPWSWVRVRYPQARPESTTGSGSSTRPMRSSVSRVAATFTRPAGHLPGAGGRSHHNLRSAGRPAPGDPVPSSRARRSRPARSWPCARTLPKPCAIAGRRARNEYGEALVPSQSVAAGDELLDGHLDLVEARQGAGG